MISALVCAARRSANAELHRLLAEFCSHELQLLEALCQQFVHRSTNPAVMFMALALISSILSHAAKSPDKGLLADIGRRMEGVGLPVAVAVAAKRFGADAEFGDDILGQAETIADALTGIRSVEAGAAAAAARRLEEQRTRAGRGDGSGGRRKRVAQACGHCGREPGAGEEAFLKCSGCRTVRFCGDACRRAAWKSGHKEACGGGGSSRR